MFLDLLALFPIPTLIWTSLFFAPDIPGLHCLYSVPCIFDSGVLERHFVWF